MPRKRDITPSVANATVKAEIERFVGRRLSQINDQMEWLGLMKDAYSYEYEKVRTQFKAVTSY